MDDMNLQFPLVLEEGNIHLKLDNTQLNVSGTPLNDKLNTFWKKFTQLRNQYVEIDHEEGAAIMNGHDEQATDARLIKKALQVYANIDKLFTAFVTENFDNVLGPGIFFMVTIGFQYPELTPWIEDIMSKATDKFKNDPYVKDYYQKAQENQQIMNGMRDIQPEAPCNEAPQPERQPIQSAPTPAQMAEPAVK